MVKEFPRNWNGTSRSAARLALVTDPILTWFPPIRPIRRLAIGASPKRTGRKAAF